MDTIQNEIFLKLLEYTGINYEEFFNYLIENNINETYLK
jgi:hypothetical protein